jgi:hypothetical protein
VANSAVYLGTIAYPFANKFSGPIRVHMTLIVYDTINTDLTVYQPNASKHCGIVGIDIISEATAVFTFKSGDWTLSTPTIGATGGYSKSVDDSILFPCLVGQPLKFRSTSTIASGTFYMIEF